MGLTKVLRAAALLGFAGLSALHAAPAPEAPRPAAAPLDDGH